MAGGKEKDLDFERNSYCNKLKSYNYYTIVISLNLLQVSI